MMLKIIAPSELAMHQQSQKRGIGRGQGRRSGPKQGSHIESMNSEA
jgi:hypothetical protein